MRNLYANFVEIIDTCKKFSKNLVDKLGNIPQRGIIPRFSDLEVSALSLTVEKMSILILVSLGTIINVDSESLLFSYLQEYKAEMPNLISRRRFNDRRKFLSSLRYERS